MNGLSQRILINERLFPEDHLEEPCQLSKVELFPKVFQSLMIFAKSSMLDV